MIKISSTELKQNTRKILKQIELKSDEPVIVYTYNEPKVVLLNYDKWTHDAKKEWQKPDIKDLKKLFVRTKEKTNSVNFFKKLRNED